MEFLKSAEESAKTVFSKLDETNKIIKNKAGVIYTLESRQLFKNVNSKLKVS